MRSRANGPSPAVWLQGRRTDIPASHAGGRPRRARRARGEAIVQTLYPEHYSIRLACRQDYAAFFERELHYRRGMRYPPLMALINAVVRGRTFDDAMSAATDVVRRLEPSAAAAGFSILVWRPHHWAGSAESTACSSS